MAEPSLIIDGVTMKEPSQIEVSRNKIWSQNSGRTQSGTFTGDVVARKMRLDVTWTPLSQEEAKAILTALEPPFISVTFKNPRTNSFTTKTFYAGDESVSVYSYALNNVTYEGLKVSLVEK